MDTGRLLPDGTLWWLASDPESRPGPTIEDETKESSVKIWIPGILPVNQARMLNIGCGLVFHPDWENIDIRPFDKRVRQVDATKELPYQSGAFDFVYASHVLEHITPHEVSAFLGEIRRVLAEDGIVRLVVPDLEQIAKAYLQALQEAKSGSADAKLKHLWMTIELVDQIARQYPDGGEMTRFLLRHGEQGFRMAEERLGYEISTALMPDGKQSKKEWLLAAAANPLFDDEALFKRRASMNEEQVGKFRHSGEVHHWMYDAVSLRALLEAYGFRQSVVLGAHDSGFSQFETYLLDTLEDGKARKPDSLYIEARKAPDVKK